MLYGLREALDILDEEGLENVFARHHHLAGGARAAVKAWGLKLCAKEPKWHSDTVTAIMVPPGFNGADVIDVAYRRYNLALGAGLSQVAGKLFRIGHLGDLNELMLLGAIAGAEMAMRDVGIEVELGSGVARGAGAFPRRHAGEGQAGRRRIGRSRARGDQRRIGANFADKLRRSSPPSAFGCQPAERARRYAFGLKAIATALRKSKGFVRCSTRSCFSIEKSVDANVRKPNFPHSYKEYEVDLDARGDRRAAQGRDHRHHQQGADARPTR